MKKSFQESNLSKDQMEKLKKNIQARKKNLQSIDQQEELSQQHTKGIQNQERLLDDSKLQKCKNMNESQVYQLIGQVCLKAQTQTDPESYQFISTGFVVEQRLVLTTAHSISTSSPSIWRFRLKRKDGSFRNYSIKNIRKCQNYEKAITEEEKIKSDWCFLETWEQTQQINYNNLQVKLLFDKLGIFDSISISQASVAGYLQENIINGTQYDENYLYTAKGRLFSSKSQMSHSCSTIEGMSGSPLFYGDKIIGMHVSGNFSKQMNRGIYLSKEMLCEFQQILFDRLSQDQARDIKELLYIGPHIKDISYDKGSVSIDLQVYAKLAQKRQFQKYIIKSKYDQSKDDVISFYQMKFLSIILIQTLKQLEQLFKLRIYPKKIKKSNIVLLLQQKNENGMTLQSRLAFRNLQISEEDISLIFLKDWDYRRQLQYQCLASFFQMALQMIERTMDKIPQEHKQNNVLELLIECFNHPQSTKNWTLSRFMCLIDTTFEINYVRNTIEIILDQPLDYFIQKSKKIEKQEQMTFLRNFFQDYKVQITDYRAKRYAVLMKTCNKIVTPLDLFTEILIGIQRYLNRAYLFLSICLFASQKQIQKKLCSQQARGQIVKIQEIMCSLKQIQKNMGTCSKDQVQMKLPIIQDKKITSINQKIKIFKNQYQRNFIFIEPQQYQKFSELEVQYYEDFYKDIQSKINTKFIRFLNSVGQNLKQFGLDNYLNPIKKQMKDKLAGYKLIQIKISQTSKRNQFVKFKQKSQKSQQFKFFDSCWRQNEKKRVYNLKILNEDHEIYRNVFNQIGKIVVLDNGQWKTRGNGFVVDDRYVLTAGHVTFGISLNIQKNIKFKPYKNSQLYGLKKVVSYEIMKTQLFNFMDMVIFQLILNQGEIFDNITPNQDKLGLIAHEYTSQNRQVQIPAALIGFYDNFSGEGGRYFSYEDNKVLIAEGCFNDSKGKQIEYNFETGPQMSGSLIVVPFTPPGIISLHKGSNVHSNTAGGCKIETTLSNSIEMATNHRIKINVQAKKSCQFQELMKKQFIRMIYNNCNTVDIFLLKFINEITRLNSFNIYLTELQLQDVYIDYRYNEKTFLKFNNWHVMSKTKESAEIVGNHQRLNKKKKIRSYQKQNLQLVLKFIEKINKEMIRSNLRQPILHFCLLQQRRQLESVQKLMIQIEDQFEIKYVGNNFQAIYKIKQDQVKGVYRQQMIKQKLHFKIKPMKRWSKLLLLVKMWPKLDSTDFINIFNLIQNSAHESNTINYFKLDYRKVQDQLLNLKDNLIISNFAYAYKQLRKFELQQLQTILSQRPSAEDITKFKQKLPKNNNKNNSNIIPLIFYQSFVNDQLERYTNLIKIVQYWDSLIDFLNKCKRLQYLNNVFSAHRNVKSRQLLESKDVGQTNVVVNDRRISSEHQNHQEEEEQVQSNNSNVIDPKDMENNEEEEPMCEIDDSIPTQCGDVMATQN